MTNTATQPTAPANGPTGQPGIPVPTTTAIVLFGVPIAIILGGTKVGPIVNLSLVAIIVGIILKGKSSTSTSGGT